MTSPTVTGSAGSAGPVQRSVRAGGGVIVTGAGGVGRTVAQPLDSITPSAANISRHQRPRPQGRRDFCLPMRRLPDDHALGDPDAISGRRRRAISIAGLLLGEDCGLQRVCFCF